ncbi:DUF2157 domain-containing protein [Gallaecimonas sp. GXIMD4217]|uniref:DUF2157 domain-containing protein n=1 Tax=Gallaecimonas sp. GXIMD4217 TaxID=3131927 RepID=UPI00311AD76B
MRLFRLFKKDMAREVMEWARDGLIQPAQAEAILARYGASPEDARAGTFGYYVLTALAALFVGLALILVLSHNWEQIPRLTRMLGLIGLTLAVNLLGLRLLLRQRYRAGVLWLFLGSLCYGAAIMLIAQIYHLGEHFPDGIFYWALGVLPVALITQSRLIGLLCLALATTWMFVEAGTGSFPYGYPLFALAALWLAWERKSSALLFLFGLAGLAVWLNYLLAWTAGGWYRFDGGAEQLAATIGLGLILAGWSRRLLASTDHNIQAYGQLLQLWLLRGLILTLLVLSFDDVWRGLSEGYELLGPATALLPALGGLAGYALARRKGPLVSLPAITLYWVLAVLCNTLVKDSDLWLAVATNLMLVAVGIGLIRRGIDEAITHFFYTGVLVLLLTALLRYVDLIGDYIGGAVLFLVAALVMFGAARYWRFHLHGEASHD